MGECLITRRGGEAYELPILNSAYPANVTVVQAANASASFNVQIATPGKPAEYTYQWYLNGVKISGATNSSYTKTGLTAAGTHTLYCVVTNKAGTVTSRVATLTVKSAKPTYTYTGSHQLIDDGNYNWRIKLKTSGTLTFNSLGNMPNGIQVFCVGGGGAGGSKSGAGGGGGYTTTGQAYPTAGTNYTVTIGAGGAYASGKGGLSRAFSVTATGGDGGQSSNPNGGNGGSGGGGASWNACAGGSNGGNGGSSDTAVGGTGQGTTTREFGESGGTLYSGGGGGGCGRVWSSAVDWGGKAGAGGGGKGETDGKVGVAGTNNLGGGGGGSGNNSSDFAKGGSGIVVIRNKR